MIVDTLEILRTVGPKIRCMVLNQGSGRLALLQWALDRLRGGGSLAGFCAGAARARTK